MVQFGAQFFVGFLHLHTGKDKGDDGIQHKRNDEVHDFKHIDAGVRLNSQGSVESAGGQQPASNGSADAAAQLDTKGSAGVHGAIHALVLGQPRVF